MCQEYGKEGREHPAQLKHEADNFSFEQAVLMTKMDEDSSKNNGRINAINNSNGDDEK